MLQSILFKVRYKVGWRWNSWCYCSFNIICLESKAYANWIVEIYNNFQSEKGVTNIKSVFRKADINEAIEMVDFTEQDPFWFI